LGKELTLPALAFILLTLLTGPAQAAPLTLPLSVSTQSTLADQFGYAPDYTRNVPAFDSVNRPFIRSRTASQHDTSFVDSLDSGVWVKSSLVSALVAAYPDFAGMLGAGGYASDRIVFDAQDRAYTVLTVRLEEGEFRNVLLYSLDHGATWSVAELPFGGEQPYYDNRDLGNVAMEYFTGHNEISGPPFIAVWREIADWPGNWASRNELWVVQPYFEGDRLVVPQPTLVTDRFLGMVQCSGGASFAATLGGQTFFVWTQITSLPKRGTPTYVGVYDRATGTVTARRRLGYALPGNDVHDTPGICADSQGVLHVLSGAHGRPMLYQHSLAPRDIAAWSLPEPVLTSGYVWKGSDIDGEGRQTYLSLVCDANDTLHIVFRQTRRNVDELYWGSKYYSLAHMSKPADGPWSPAQQLIVAADGPGYVNYYQKLAVDRRGQLYLSLNVFRRTDPVWMRPYRRFRQRMVLHSTDGLNWDFATTETFQAGLL